MFIVSLHYIKPLEQIELHLEAHKQFLKAHYAKGDFIMSGAKIPRTGGIILINTMNRETLYALLSKDPFQQHNIAEYEIIEFTPSLHELSNFVAC